MPQSLYKVSNLITAALINSVSGASVAGAAIGVLKCL
jgi:hypothetical protein